MDKKRCKRLYVIAFWAMAAVITSCYYVQKRSFIWYADGWNQYYRVLVYLADYLREILVHLFQDHALIIPVWDISIGEGSDIFQTFYYYGFLDPIKWLSVLVPVKWMHFFYDFSILLRLFLSGLFFCDLCFELGKSQGIVAAAMVYVFSSYCVVLAFRFPSFGVPVMYAPLLVWGLARIWQGKSAKVYIIGLIGSVCSSFYFFYMLAIGIGILVVVRAVVLYGRTPRRMMYSVLQILGYSLLAIGLIGVVVFPVMYTFLSDHRMGNQTNLPLHYSWYYYRHLLGLWVGYGTGGDAWNCLGYGAITIVAVVLMVCHIWKDGNRYKEQQSQEGNQDRNQESIILTILLGLCLIFLAFPFFGHVFNGMSYVINRWCFLISLLVAYILCAEWESVLAVGKSIRERVLLWGGLAVLLALLILVSSKRDMSVIVGMIGAVGYGLLVTCVKQDKWRRLGLFLILYMQIGVNIVWVISDRGEQLVSQGKSWQAIAESYETSDVAEIVGRFPQGTLLQDGYWGRYSGGDITRNESIYTGVSTTQYYWTLSNPYVEEFRRKMELPESSGYDYIGYDGRSGLLALHDVRYYSSKGEVPIRPYGYDYKGLELFWENQVPVSPVCYYDTYMDLEDWDALSSVDKEEILLQTAVLGEHSDIFLKKAEEVLTSSEEIGYSHLPKMDGIVWEGSTISVNESGAEVVMFLDASAGQELFLTVEGLQYHGDPKKYWLSIQIEASNGSRKNLVYWPPTYDYYNGRHDYTVDLGYLETGVDSIVLSFLEPGIYTYTDMTITGRNMERYGALLEQRMSDTELLLRPGCFSETISYEVEVDTEGLSVLAIPYGKGWKAYVDGQKTGIVPVNIMNMGVWLPEGRHMVMYVYHPPWLGLGGMISMMSILLVISLWVYKKRRDVSERREV